MEEAEQATAEAEAEAAAAEEAQARATAVATSQRIAASAGSSILNGASLWQLAMRACGASVETAGILLQAMEDSGELDLSLNGA